MSRCAQIQTENLIVIVLIQVRLGKLDIPVLSAVRANVPVVYSIVWLPGGGCPTADLHAAEDPVGKDKTARMVNKIPRRTARRGESSRFVVVRKHPVPSISIDTIVTSVKSQGIIKEHTI